MARENDYDNDGLDQLEEYFRKKKKVMMRIPISLQKNRIHLIIEYLKLKKILSLVISTYNNALSGHI